MHLPSPTTERAPLILVFGLLAARMAALLRSRTSLTARITFAPREAIHAIAAFLYLSPDAAKVDAEVASLIEKSDPRELLAQALPNCPARLYRALNTAGDLVRPQSFYQRLGVVCDGPFGAELLDGDLNDQRLSFYEAIQSMDPLVADCRTALSEMLHAAEAVDTLLVLIRSHGALGECDFALPKNARMNALLRRLMRGLDAIRAPKPLFTAPPPFRVVRSIGELRQIGRQYRNCLVSPTPYAMRLWFGLADGSLVFIVRDEPPVLISLRQAGHNVWRIEEIDEPEAAPPHPMACESEVKATLRGAGVNLVCMDPAHAMAKLTRVGRRRDDDDDEDEFADALDMLD